MSKKPVNGSGVSGTADSSSGRFTGKRSKDDTINDLIVELGRGGLDNNSVHTLIRGLRQKYPKNVEIIKLSEALGLEPEKKRNEKDLPCRNNRSKADFAKNDQPGLEETTSSVDSGDRKNAASIVKYTPTNFYRAVSSITLVFQNMEPAIMV
jgi:hypothetical protein